MENNQVLTPVKLDEGEPYPLFTLNIQSDGKLSLTIRTSDEKQLEELLNTWEPILCDGDPDARVVNGNFKQRYYPGDNCPTCNGKVIRKRGRNGPFLSCKNYPECHWSQSL
jgi:hypothetical protein